MAKKSRNTQTKRIDLINGYSVLYAAFELLNMEKNGIVEYTPAARNESFDVPEECVNTMAINIKRIENNLLLILRSIRLDPSEEASVLRKTNTMREAFFDSGILKLGVSPHLLFTCVLFAYFADTGFHQIAPVFGRLKTNKLYDDVFVELEESKKGEWCRHMDAAYEIIEKGIGIHRRTSESMAS